MDFQLIRIMHSLQGRITIKSLKISIFHSAETLTLQAIAQRLFFAVHPDPEPDWVRIIDSNEVIIKNPTVKSRKVLENI